MQMRVYIEFVIIDNMVVTSLAACLSYGFTGTRVRKIRVAVAAVAGTVVSVFYPFWSMPTPLIILAKLFVGVVLSAVLYAGVSNVISGMLTFFASTALLGGACFAADCFIEGDLGLALSEPSNIPYCLPSVISAAIYLPSRILISAARKRRAESAYGYDVLITVNGITAKLRGYLDTGNGLEDNGTPVAVVKMSSFVRRFGEGALAAASAEKTAVGVGDASTRLILIKPDRFLLYFDKKRNKHSDVILGVCVGGFSRREDILLPVSVLGG